MTGFSSDKLASLQEAGDEYALSPSPLSPLCLYPTPLEQFTHHWDIVEVRSQLSCNYSQPHAHTLTRTHTLSPLPVRITSDETEAWEVQKGDIVFKLKRVDILDIVVVF